MPAVLSGSNVTAPNMLKLGRFAAFKSDDTRADSSMGEPVSGPNASSSALPDGRWELVWALRRHWALSPKQFNIGMACLLLASLISASIMWHANPAWVLPFAVAETLLVILAAFVYARHDADQDFIGLRDDVLRVETHRGGQVLRWDFNPRWVRIEPRDATGSLIRLSGHGRFVDVGRYLRDDLRLQLAAELRWAIRQLTH